MHFLVISTFKKNRINSKWENEIIYFQDVQGQQTPWLYARSGRNTSSSKLLCLSLLLARINKKKKTMIEWSQHYKLIFNMLMDGCRIWSNFKLVLEICKMKKIYLKWRCQRGHNIFFAISLWGFLQTLKGSKFCSPRLDLVGIRIHLSFYACPYYLK